MQADDTRSLGVLEMAGHGLPDLRSEFIERFGLSENVGAQRPRGVSAVRFVFDNLENQLLIVC